MAAPIEFWFDFSSPYGYLAAQKIDALAAKYGRGVDWRPLLLGPVFKSVGTAPLLEIPLKGVYAKRDIARSARFHGITDLRMPSRFPIPTQTAARLVVWQKGIDAERATRLAKALFRAYWFDDVDISVPGNAVAVAAREGVDAAAARAAIDDPAVKDALKRDVDEAMAKGVFGSPYVIVDGEPFWGIDHFDQLEKWLATGGF
jgi:2-hydroxychromene-2-carboxylate isomerase